MNEIPEAIAAIVAELIKTHNLPNHPQVFLVLTEAVIAGMVLQQEISKKPIDFSLN